MKELEFIKIKEWEEKFDREQKLKEKEENLKELKLKEKEIEKERILQRIEEESNNSPSLGLEKFDVDKTKEN